MGESIVVRAQKLKMLAERKLSAEQRAQRATRLADRTTVLSEWVAVLEKTRQLREVLQERRIEDIPANEPAKASPAQVALQAYRDAAPWRESEAGDDGQAAWTTLGKPMRSIVTREQKDVAESVTRRREVCLARISASELIALTNVPGLEAHGAKLQSLRRDIADANWKDPSAPTLRRLLERVNEYGGLMDALGDLGPAPSAEVKAFCTLARGPTGAPLGELTDDVREWFDQMKQMGRLRIHMK